jgi:hypothetical protein
MKRILITLLFIAPLLTMQLSQASTFIGNGGQTGDIELAVTLRQVSGAIERIQSLTKEFPEKKYCVCPEYYADHQLCEIINKLTEEQKNYCERFIKTQLPKLERAAQATRFEWVPTAMVNRNSVGDRVVDAVARKDKNLIYIDQTRFVEISEYNRVFLLTHELFHMDTYEGAQLDDEDKIGPFKHQYGVRDLLNAAAAGITLTSIDETVFQDYTKYLNQSRPTKRHWVGWMSSSSSVQDEKSTNFQTSMDRGSRFSYQYQFPSLFNFGLTAQVQTQSGEKTLLDTISIKEKRSTTAVGITFRYFIFNHLDPFAHFWSTFLQLEVLHERLNATFSMRDDSTNEESSVSSTSPSVRASLYFPMKHGFWLNTGLEFSQHKIYYPEFDYTLTSKSPTFFIGATYGF